MQNLQSAFGIFALLAIAWIVSEDRRGVAWRQAAVALIVTFATAVILLKVPAVTRLFAAINNAVDAIAAASKAGTSFVFGYLGGGELPFELKVPGAEFVLALQALPIVLVMSVLTTLLFHWRILPPVVRGFSWVLERTLKVGGAVGLSTAANIFLGMAGTVLVIYATLLGPIIPDAAAHFVIASVMGAPAAILISLIMVPEDVVQRAGGETVEVAKVASSTMDAIVRGTAAGLELLLNICAMLIVLVALVHLANAIIAGILPEVAGAPITLQRVLGYVMAPVCWLIGIPWSEAATAGALMGIKTVLNEFIAYVELSKLPPETLDARSRLIMLYAMCGFANFGSLGIMIAGLSTMAPQRRDDVLSLGLKSILSGTLATCLMAAIVGMLT